MAALHPLAPDPTGDEEDVSLERVVPEKQRVLHSEPPRLEDVSPDAGGVAQLLVAGAYRAAASLASQLLAIKAQQLTPAEKTALRTRRAVALAAAGMLAEAAAEGDALLPDGSGLYDDDTAVPFMLRFAKAQLPGMLRASRGPTALYELLAWLERIEKTQQQQQPQQKQLWEARICFVLGAIAMCHAMGGEYDMAIEAFERIVARRPTDPHALSELGRMYIAAGGLAQAASFFREAERFLPDGARAPLALANAALLKISREEYSPAIEMLLQARASGNTQDMANNTAVAWVYAGNLGRGLAGLREAVSRDPRGEDTDVLVANLSILYDLTSEIAVHKKQELLAFVQSHTPKEPQQ